jgi:hypothetical protein
MMPKQSGKMPPPAPLHRAGSHDNPDVGGHGCHRAARAGQQQRDQEYQALAEHVSEPA